MKPFTEEMRYDYPLTADSLVIDIGSYKGEFARKIGQSGCRVIGFEPIKEFWDEAIQNQSPTTTIYNFALGGKTDYVPFFVRNNSTGRYMESEEIRLCSVIDVDTMDFEDIDLMKLNVEGSEFDILERMIETGMHKNVDNLQIQFHVVIPDAVERRDKIRKSLSVTHSITYDEPWTWENWKRK